MKKVNFEDIPELFLSGKLSEKEASDLIWVELYTHPHFYHLSCMDEDMRSDFLIQQYSIYPSLCRKYQRGRISFRAYLRTILYHRKFRYQRKEREKAWIDHDISLSMISELQGKSVENEELSKIDRDANPAKELKLTAKKRLISETSLLILAMKFCHDMDDSLLQHISKYTKIPMEKLNELILRMQKQSERKRRKFNILRKKRDNCYFLHKRYAMQLRNFPMSEEMQEITQKKYELQTRLWKKHNETLNGKYISSPSNQEISEELGITARQVSFYINHFKNRKTQLFQTDEGDDGQNDAK